MEAYEDEPARPWGGGAARPGGATAGGRSTATTSTIAQSRIARATGNPVQSSTCLVPVKVTATTAVPPAPFRIITAPVRAAPAQDMWNRRVVNREEVDYAEELEKLTKSAVTMASGLAKIFSGFRLKVITKEDKEKTAAAEKEALEKKKTEEKRLAAEEKMIAVKGPAKLAEWRKKKEEEDTKKREEEEKERRLAFLLSVPGYLTDASALLEGVREVGCGGKDTALVLCQMIRGIPSLMRRHLNAPTSSSFRASVMGTGSVGLRMAADRYILTRSYDSRLMLIDGFGTRKETIPRPLGGTLVISTLEELAKAVTDYRNGKLNQLLDIDAERVNLMTARNLWCLLCREQLTGLLCPNCVLPELALRADALIQEEKALEAHFNEAQKVVEGLQSCIDVIGHKLGRSTTARAQLDEKQKEKFD